MYGKASAGPKIKIQKLRKGKSKTANPEHLAKLKEGVEAWNKWRIARWLILMNSMPSIEEFKE